MPTDELLIGVFAMVDFTTVQKMCEHYAARFTA